MQLIYASRPFGYDDLTLTSILMQARENNARNGITGALICREDVFLQILEGPRDLVTSTFSRILRDERHVDVVNLLSSEIDRRLFPKWSMRHDPAQSWMWTPEEVARGAIGRASDREIRGIFERLARASMHVAGTCTPHPLAAKPTTSAGLKSLRSARLKYCLNPLAVS